MLIGSSFGVGSIYVVLHDKMAQEENSASISKRKHHKKENEDEDIHSTPLLQSDHQSNEDHNDENDDGNESLFIQSQEMEFDHLVQDRDPQEEESIKRKRKDEEEAAQLIKRQLFKRAAYLQQLGGAIGSVIGFILVVLIL